MRRCFVGLRVDDKTRSSAHELANSLQRLPPAARRLRPVPLENLHATVKFLGPTTEADLPRLRQVLARAAEQAPLESARVELVGLDAFPQRNKPRAIFFAAPSSRALVRLFERVEAEVVPLGFAPEGKPRIPHVTLARVEGARNGGPLSRFIEDTPRIPYGAIDCTALVLFESLLGEPHSRYVPLFEIPLARA